MVSVYEPVIGIDLGTTYSCVSLFKPDGSIEILKDEFGMETIASVICFKSEHEALVGRAA